MSISLVDIKRAIIGTLKDKYNEHTIYAEQIPQNFTRPSFFIYFVPLETVHDSRYYIGKSVMVKIDYYSENKTNEENLIMADELEQLFHKDLPVKDRYLTVTRTNSEDIDGVLVFTINLSYENGIGLLKIENEDGETVYIEDGGRLGYTKDNVKLMENLDLRRG